ncbi:hypothetical protein H097_15466 [Pseudomonas sp. FH4]|nr:hypothetical protein H097_15466 [Pseudomonas sp. FH4]
MFRAKGVREKGFPEHIQGGEVLEMAQFVLEKVIAEKPTDGISRLSDLKKRDLRSIAESELIEGVD